MTVFLNFAQTDSKACKNVAKKACSCERALSLYIFHCIGLQPHFVTNGHTDCHSPAFSQIILFYKKKKKKKDKNKKDKKKKDKKKDWVKTWDRLNFKNSVSER